MNTNNEVFSLVHRASLLRRLAAALLYPDAGAGSTRLLRDIAAIPADDMPVLAALQRAVAMTDEESLREEYSRLFIGADAIVLHETSYTGTGRSTELADISGFYLAFGFDLREGQHEVADHLGMQLEFHSLMLLKQAYALEQGWQDNYEIARAATCAFLADHLGRWVDKVQERASERQAAPIYRILFEAIATCMRRECQLFAVQPAPLMCSGPDFMQDAAFVCPMEQVSTGTPSGAARGEPK